jgi:hypothetical protein
MEESSANMPQLLPIAGRCKGLPADQADPCSREVPIRMEVVQPHAHLRGRVRLPPR